jgi:N-acetylglucosaminyldiphosphoundecaprenol N-acetyl-beta-D-mannosaminyltransferase
MAAHRFERTGASCGRDLDDAARVELLGVGFDYLTTRQCVDAVAAYVDGGAPRVLWTPNVAVLVESRTDGSLRTAWESADMVTVDGMGLYYGSRLLGKPAPEAVSGSVLFFELLALARDRGLSVFFLGAEDDVVRAAGAWAQATYHPLRVAGVHHGYFGPARAADVAESIRRSAPDILLVGMSSPLKERFVSAYRDEMGVPVTLGVGGMFDIAAGRRRLAPAVVRVLCLEWLWRLAQEPRRLWRRYAVTNTVFLGLLMRELARSRRRRACHES